MNNLNKILYFSLIEEDSPEHIKKASKFLYDSNFTEFLTLKECIYSYINFRKYYDIKSIEIEILVNLVLDNFKIPDNLKNYQFKNVFNILEKIYEENKK